MHLHGTASKYNVCSGISEGCRQGRNTPFMAMPGPGGKQKGSVTRGQVIDIILVTDTCRVSMTWV